jgi:hypothetical protein
MPAAIDAQMRIGEPCGQGKPYSQRNIPPKPARGSTLKPPSGRRRLTCGYPGDYTNVRVTFQEQSSQPRGRAAMMTPANSTVVSAGHGVDRSKSGVASTDGPGVAPHRRGRLKNGNPAGDFLAAPRCGARTRCGGSCRQPAMPNGRCRLHGGLSTGPRTPDGLARSRRARWKHGARSAEVTALRREVRMRLRRVRTALALVAGHRSAGHGVDRSTFTKPLVRANFEPAGAASARTPAAPSFAPSPASGTIRVHPRSQTIESPFSAGHGVDRPLLASNAPAQRSSGARADLYASTAPMASPAGHGLHRSFSFPAPAARHQRADCNRVALYRDGAPVYR